MDGPLTRAVKAGAICYLDEIVEARKDTTVLIHPLTDHRRILPIERRGQVIQANENFLLVISYNPGYQTVLKDLNTARASASLPSSSTIRPRTWNEKSSAMKAACRKETAGRLALSGRQGAQFARAWAPGRRQHSLC